jgi:hypothetical protein
MDIVGNPYYKVYDRFDRFLAGFVIIARSSTLLVEA